MGSLNKKEMPQQMKRIDMWADRVYLNPGTTAYCNLGLDQMNLFQIQ